MIPKPSIRVAGFANFFPFRSVIAPTRSGMNSMNWRFVPLPETGRCLIVLLRRDSTRRHRGILGARTGIRIERTQATPILQGLTRVPRKVNHRRRGIRKAVVMVGRRVGSIGVQKDRPERILGTMVREMAVKAIREVAVREAVRPPDSIDWTVIQKNGNLGCRFLCCASCGLRQAVGSAGGSQRHFPLLSFWIAARSFSCSLRSLSLARTIK